MQTDDDEDADRSDEYFPTTGGCPD